MKDRIMVLTRAQDRVADHLVREMEKRALPVLRFDTSEFPLSACLDASFDDGVWRGHLHSEHGSVALEEIRSTWYHRPTHYRINEELAAPYREFAEGEAIKGFDGLLRSLNCLWVSHPDALHAASFKPVQLHHAHALGWRTPRTLLTNNPDAVRRFYEDCEGRIICKALSNGHIALGGDAYRAVYTSVVTDEMLAHIENVRHTTTLLQEHIPKALELRITVIGTATFAVAIHSQSSERTRIDWRRSYPDLTYSIYALPAGMEAACVALLRTLHLNYGALDVVVTPTGEYVFLEINPSGQYRWLEEITGLPLTEALVDLLAAGRGLC